MRPSEPAARIKQVLCVSATAQGAITLVASAGSKLSLALVAFAKIEGH
jgi:hypothetical protein